MRIASIDVENFKSLANFSLPLAKFNCLIGLNGAGKSTLLQFIDFLATQMRGDVSSWLDARSWKASDFHSSTSSKKNVSFTVRLSNLGKTKETVWRGQFNTNQLYCTQETIETPDAMLDVQGGTIRIADKNPDAERRRKDLLARVPFKYEGSIVARLRDTILPESIEEFRRYWLNVKSLDLLAPESMRQRTRESSGSIGLRGQKLSAFLYELGTTKRKKLTEMLRQVYPNLHALSARSLRSGWKQLDVSEVFEDKSSESKTSLNFRTEARHINDGLLRLVAILAELETDHAFLLFDEIENGVNPEVVSFLLEKLLTSRKQILVTTHSPLILNYLTDEIAQEGVMYIYKDQFGCTNTVPFFSIPSVAQKLKVMGPGEAFADTSLRSLLKEINKMKRST